MVTVAGGTSKTLGRSIVTALKETGQEAVILSRIDKWANGPETMYGAKVRYVDYTRQDNIIRELSGVHTVISVIKVEGEFWAKAQINLLRAARLAGVKRFAASEFALGPRADGRVDVMAMKDYVRKEVDRYNREDIMECTRFCCGMFMNYLAAGFDDPNAWFGDPNAKELLDGLEDPPIIWNLAAKSIEMPVKDNGMFPRITMTTIKDVGRFVAATCEMPDGVWPPVMGMAGSTIGCSQVNELIEKIFCIRPHTTFVKRAELQQRVNSVEGIGSTRDEVFAKMIAQIELLMLEDNESGRCLLKPTANNLFPHIKPESVEEFLTRLRAALPPTWPVKDIYQNEGSTLFKASR